MQKSKMTRNIALSVLFFLGLTAYVQVSAQTLFRCGKTYQDRPCDAGQETKVLTPSRSGATGMQGSVDASCVQQGIDAQKIVWSREAGAMLDQQLAKARSKDERGLISNAYNKRGTSSEIRASIEAECVAEKERAARLAALTGQSAPPAAAVEVSDPTRQNDPYRQTAAKRNLATEEAAQKKASCERLKERLESVRNGQREGGSSAAMEMFRRDKLDIERQLFRDRC
jgi:hypothetical protein